jgi:hypothetical protein
MTILKTVKTILIFSLIVFVIILSYLFVTTNKQLKATDNNYKALVLDNSNLKNEIIAYKFNVEQLKYLNDSIIKDLDSTRIALGIKDRQLKQLQSIKTEINTKDTIHLKDTVFKRDFVKLDTIINNKWYTTKLTLEYPSTIKIASTYMSDLSVFAYSNKEILGTPKKCFIGRLFQKKYNIIRVEVVDANPFSEIKESKFVIIE